MRVGESSGAGALGVGGAEYPVRYAIDIWSIVGNLSASGLIEASDYVLLTAHLSGPEVALTLSSGEICTAVLTRVDAGGCGEITIQDPLPRSLMRRGPVPR